MLTYLHELTVRRILQEHKTMDFHRTKYSCSHRYVTGSIYLPSFAIFKYSNAEKCCLRYQTMTTQHSILCKTLQFFIKRQLKTFQELCAEFLREWWKQLWSLFTPGRNSYSESIEMISFRVAYRHVMNGREWRPQFLFISMVES